MAHTPLVLWHGYANSCVPSTWCSSAPLVDSGYATCKMGLICHLTSRLATGRSALDPLQRSCGTKVRRAAACRWILSRTGCVNACLVCRALALTSFRWTMGSVLFLAAWAVMMGPIQYGKQASLQFSCTPADPPQLLTTLQSSTLSLVRDFRSLLLILGVLHSHCTFRLV